LIGLRHDPGFRQRHRLTRSLSLPIMEEIMTKTPLYCSFCGKHQNEVVRLIAGPTVFICDECVNLCKEIIDGEETPLPDAQSSSPWPPHLVVNTTSPARGASFF
jgi:hypothetical protein